MVISVFLGVLTNRKAISLRLVAFAATYLLARAPESLVGVSFQMSFAAVVALVAVFERFGSGFMNKFRGDNSFRQKIMYFIIGSLFTSMIAEVAISPFALYHFNKVVLFGLLANLVAMPVMGSWGMQWIVVTLVLMSFGLEKFALIAMSWGLEAIMATAYWVSSLPGATLEILVIDIKALIFLVFGALWLGIWRLKWRFLGIPMICMGLFFAITYQHPDILIDNSLSLSRMNSSRIVKDR
jgi:competence protein ComEC